MTLGALADLGVGEEALRAGLAALGLDGWRLDFCREERCGFWGTRALVHIHAHEHTHEHAHRAWKDIRGLIENSGLEEGVKARALAIFGCIARAEAEVHGVCEDAVTFHEVGALDSIIDIVGAAFCLEYLHPDKITCGRIELGGGTVECAHGVIPVPAPATERILRGCPVRTGGFDSEMTTPTGAAILAASVDEWVTGPASFRVTRSGAGIGSRRLAKPNILRVSLRETESAAPGAPYQSEELVILESNIDDMTGEALGFCMDRLFAAGALDVTFTSCVMKKSRPGIIARVLAAREKRDALIETFFRHSAAAGLREIPCARLSLRREEKVLDGAFGTAREKTLFWAETPLRSKIEFDDRAALALSGGCALDAAEARIRESKK
jgi:uncharacterized protein (TIGR00299 family) protein